MNNQDWPFDEEYDFSYQGNLKNDLTYIRAIYSDDFGIEVPQMAQSYDHVYISSFATEGKNKSLAFDILKAGKEATKLFLLKVINDYKYEQEKEKHKVIFEIKAFIPSDAASSKKLNTLLWNEKSPLKIILGNDNEALGVPFAYFLFSKEKNMTWSEAEQLLEESIGLGKKIKGDWYSTEIDVHALNKKHGWKLDAAAFQNVRKRISQQLELAAQYDDASEKKQVDIMQSLHQLGKEDSENLPIEEYETYFQMLFEKFSWISEADDPEESEDWLLDALEFMNKWQVALVRYGVHILQEYSKNSELAIIEKALKQA